MQIQFRARSPAPHVDTLFDRRKFPEKFLSSMQLLTRSTPGIWRRNGTSHGHLCRIARTCLQSHPMVGTASDRFLSILRLLRPRKARIFGSFRIRGRGECVAREPPAGGSNLFLWLRMGALEFQL